MGEDIFPMTEELDQNCNGKMNTHLYPNHSRVASSIEGVQKVKKTTSASYEGALCALEKESYKWKMLTMT
jgi:hypothetical protein